jgi:hypothetical protein
LNARELLSLGRRELAQLLEGGHPVDPAALDDSQYRGLSLAQPRLVTALTWLTFRKTFHRDPQTRRLRGWNVRLEQRGLDAPSVPQRRNGGPKCFGHYEVVSAEGRRTPIAHRGLLIDYGAGGEGGLLGKTVDPLVALEAGSVEWLLGVSYLEVGARGVLTPTWFALEREGPLDHVEPAPAR